MNLLEKGWECPKCGAVMSPTTSVCVNCRGVAEKSVSTNYISTKDNDDYPIHAYVPRKSQKGSAE